MKKRILASLAVGLILATHFATQLYLAKNDSQTTDEGVHLSAGYTYWKYRDFRYNPEHPVLVKVIAASPLLFLRVNLPTDERLWDKASNFFYDSWWENRKYGEEMLYSGINDANKILFAGRLPMILIAVALGLVIFLIARALWGIWGGVLSLSLFAFDPNFLAQGHLITTDVALSLGYLITIFLFWQFLEKRNWRKLIWFSLALGLTLLTKFTAVITLVSLIAILGYYLLAEKPLGKKADAPVKSKKKSGFALKLSAAVIIAWLVVAAGYGFRLKPAPESANISEEILNANFADETKKKDVGQDYDLKNIKGVKIPFRKIINKGYPGARHFIVPKDFFKGMVMVFNHTQGGHESFLLGKTSDKGWWYYFPALIFLKTPLPSLGLMIAGVWVGLRRKKRLNNILLIGAAVFLLVALTSRANLGLRHVFPIYPLLFISAGSLVTLKLKGKAYYLAGAILLILSGFILSFPNYFTYYNALAGGAKNGYKIATDSNMDWGQDLRRIKQYLDEKNIDNAWVIYDWDGEAALDYYGIRRQQKSTLTQDSKGIVVIGVTRLNQPRYQWIKDRQLLERITDAVFVYKLN